MRRVFSGIQPSGELHIGNYLGAVKRWVELQNQHECYFCIVDYHAITQEYEVGALEARTLDMAVSLLASGLDPERCVLFVQSHVPEHTELCWVFTSVAPIGELERMTQFKEKAQRQESVPAGLMNYPVLQAADVLLYKASLVPVGEDQLQHLELMREIARKFNARYGEGFFPEPEGLVGPAKRILGLDGEAKMSKSLGNTIGLLDDAETIWERLRPAKTDPARVRRQDRGTPEICNIYALHQHFSPSDVVEQVATKCRTAGWGCLDCKRVLADHITAVLAPVRERAAELKAKPQLVHEILAAGAERAREVARDTMQGVRELLGLVPARGGILSWP
ncbi:MAG: tryptophan--tRNA ligase [Gemmatimonadetes bacterium RBG_16_66_8]|nr:MAG: tryptophan--tRNA ligase [Gemmatimonadetes bacterium RBG_16_66_8]